MSSFKNCKKKTYNCKNEYLLENFTGRALVLMLLAVANFAGKNHDNFEDPPVSQILEAPNRIDLNSFSDVNID